MTEPMASESLHISVDIDRPAREVYDYASDPANLPAWSSGIGDSIEYVEGEWVVASPAGRAVIVFAGANDFGVLDHTVTFASGATFYNPMRVTPRGDGSEVDFTLRRSPGQTDANYKADAAAVAADLHSLKALIEG